MGHNYVLPSIWRFCSVRLGYWQNCSSEFAIAKLVRTAQLLQAENLSSPWRPEQPPRGFSAKQKQRQNPKGKSDIASAAEKAWLPSCPEAACTPMR
jgi:hypothetical protein